MKGVNYMNKMLEERYKLNHLIQEEEYNLNHLTQEEELIILNRILNNIQNRNFIIKNISVNSPEFDILRKQIAEDNKVVQKIINNKKINEKELIKKINEQELIEKMKSHIEDNPDLLKELKRKAMFKCQW